MSLRWLIAFLVMVVLLWIWFAVWVIRFVDSHFLYELGLMLTGAAFSGFFWMGYSAYLMYRVIPRIDPIVDQDTHEGIVRHGDFQVFRFHRLGMYAMSSAWRWANGRVHPQYDFRQLGPHFRLPLQVHWYWLWLALSCAFVGLGAFKLAEYLGIQG